jgi:transcriptional regulator with XRE-family HTH domain
MDKTPPLAAFSRRLCRAMAERNMSVTQLSAKTGIAASHLSRYRAGVKEPMLCNLMKICRAIPVSADYLCAMDDRASPDPTHMK